MYRFVASDMDETFLGRDHAVPEANVRAVRRLAELGVPFVPCSGRPYASVVRSLGPVRDCLDYVISYNGACINRVGEERPIQAHGMPYGTIRELFARGRELGIGMHVYQMDGLVWCWRLDDEETRRIDGLMDIRDLPGDDVDFLAEVPLAKILYYSPDDARLREVAREMEPTLPRGVAVTFSSGRYLEFVRDDVDKGTGIADLARILGVPLSEVIACGDAPNDDAMLVAAGLGVTVRGADPSTAALADYRASSTCDEGVVDEVLERFVEPEHRP